jgi:predicted methyltransferase
VLKDSGTFYAAQFNPNGPYGYQRRALGAFLSKLGANPDLYGEGAYAELTFQAMYDALKPGGSPVLKNPKDTKDHPSGVWTLPPSLALGDKDRAKYEAIGESDRFLLKLVKPTGA